MAANIHNKIKLLQKALNSRGQNITVVTTQHFFNSNPTYPLNQWHIKQGIHKENGWKYKELFSSYKPVDILLFLRDMWFNLNGYELPRDKEWAKRKKYRLELTAKFKGEY